MATVASIIEATEKMAGHPLRDEEGVLHGPADREVRRATVAWVCSPRAIEAAGRAGHELLISHECPSHPYGAIRNPGAPADWRRWPANVGRFERLDRFGLTLLRIHACADEICILDVFAEQLGLGPAVEVDGNVKVYQIDPVPLAQLVERVKARMGMAALRVADGGDPNRVVHRVGLPWGGVGLFVNVGYQQRLVERGCDVFIAGESDSHGFRFAVESGIAMIETGHEISENPGLARFTELLAEAVPEVSFNFYENSSIWRIA